LDLPSTSNDIPACAYNAVSQRALFGTTERIAAEEDVVGALWRWFCGV
jgi:hypothetical protein